MREGLDPQICPDNSEIFAYISSGDIWVINMVSGHNVRLTNAHDENKTLSDNPLSAGVPSYVMQEEFSRYDGFWWQPQTEGKQIQISASLKSANKSNVNHFQMMFIEFCTKKSMRVMCYYSSFHHRIQLK